MSLASSFFCNSEDEIQIETKLVNTPVGVLDDDNREWETMGWKFLSLGEWHTVCSVRRVDGLEGGCQIISSKITNQGQHWALSHNDKDHHREEFKSFCQTSKFMEQRAKAGQKCKLWHSVTAQAGLAYHRYSNIGQDAFWWNEHFFREDKVQIEVYCCWITCFFNYVLTGKYSVTGISYCMAFGSDFDFPPRFWATHRRFSQSHVLVWGQLFAWYKNANDRVKKEETPVILLTCI